MKTVFKSSEIFCSFVTSGIFFDESSVLIKSSSLISSSISSFKMSFFPSSNLFIIPSDGCLDSQFVDDLLMSSTEFELILEVGIFVKFSSDKFWGFFASSSSFV